MKKIRNSIREILRTNNIKLNLKPGNELYFSNNMVHLLREKEASSINNSRYVLFEFPINEEPMDIYEYIYLLQEEFYIPILAHPERYKFVQRNPEIINDLVERGVLIQSNYGSIMGCYGKKAKLLVEKFLECNLVHFLGSDVHRKNTIYPIIPEAMKKISKIVGKENLEIITEINPNKVIQNEDIEIFEPQKIKISAIDRFVLKS